MKAIDNLLATSGIGNNDNAQIVNIRQQLFEVVGLPKPASQPMEIKGKLVNFDAPKGIQIYKTTGGACLGEAKDTYDILQPETFFESISQALKSIDYDFDKNTIEYLPTKNDQVISFKIPLTEIKFKNAAKKGDITEVYALFTTSFDGSIATSLCLYSIRLLCGNGVLFTTMKDISFKFRHTVKMNARALTYADAILKSSKGIEKYETIFKKLNEIEIRTEKQINTALQAILGYDISDFQDLHVKRQAVVEGIRNGWEIERGRTGNTAFGLYNAVTYTANYDANGKKRDFEYTAFGTGANINKAVEKQIPMLLTL